MNKKELFAKIPAVDKIMLKKEIIDLEKKYPRNFITEIVRNELESLRKKILNLKENENLDIKEEEILIGIIKNVEKNYKLKLRSVINASGVVIHTNLGRSLISEEIAKHMIEVATKYNNLEYDIENGKRGSRYDHLEKIIKKITNAEDVLVVNNNAAAVMLVLSSLAKDKEVIVSRGELVEIGGSFRVPSVMEQSGAKLIEVGTTNKTYAKDYENEINENTAAIMKVHTSNFRVLGFTKSPTLKELKETSEKFKIPFIEDLGSGLFIDISKYGLTYEPTVKDSIDAGVDIVTFSGDKMLGGPQAGIIVGKKEYIEKMKKNQLTRALRVDKFTIAALEATLRVYLNEEDALNKIPTLKMLTQNKEKIRLKAENLISKINVSNEIANIKIKEDESQVGGGSMPLERIKTFVVSIIPKKISVAKLEKLLRIFEPHIIARISEDSYILDLRTVLDNQIDLIALRINEVLNY